MKFRPIKITDVSGAKLTIQKSGRFGLSKNAADILMVNKTEGSYKFCKFLYGEENDADLYMEMLQEKEQYCLEVRKSGDYYYIKAAILFVELGLDYKDTSKTIMFDIEPVKIEDRYIYRLRKRVIDKK